MSSELGEVRTEDSFDVDAVHEWLRENADVPAEIPRVQQFGSGASNLTYLLTYKDQELILRRLRPMI
jgi:aminoglycoside phosphotransferase (APT) family kinase protein